MNHSHRRRKGCSTCQLHVTNVGCKTQSYSSATKRLKKCYEQRATSQQGGEEVAKEDAPQVNLKNLYVFPLMTKKQVAPKVNIEDIQLKRRLEEISPEIPINMGGDVGTSLVRIVSYIKVDPNDMEAKKKLN